MGGGGGGGGVRGGTSDSINSPNSNVTDHQQTPNTPATHKPYETVLLTVYKIHILHKTVTEIK